MKSRCNNPNFPDYDKYGGRGISVCERWNSFVNFLEDMGERPAGMSLDRFPDGGGNYEPSNCRWATVAQQLENRCNTIFLTIDGVTKSYVEWEKDSGLPRRLIYNRLIAGWDPKDAVTRPKGNYAKSGLYAQKLENRCNTIFLTIDGVTKSYVEWEKDSGLPRRLIYNRLIAGWDPKDAVTRPKGNYAKSGLYLNYKGKGPRVQQI